MRVNNNRVYWQYKHLNSTIVTECKIVNEEDRTIGIGVTEKSNADEHNKDMARKISLERAMKDAGISKKKRKKWWEAYRTVPSEPRW